MNTVTVRFTGRKKDVEAAISRLRHLFSFIRQSDPKRDTSGKIRVYCTVDFNTLLNGREKKSRCGTDQRNMKEVNSILSSQKGDISHV